MNASSRHTLIAMACAFAGGLSLNAQAQDNASPGTPGSSMTPQSTTGVQGTTSPSTSSSDTMGSQQNSTTNSTGTSSSGMDNGSNSSSLQTLPSEPTAAGYSSGYGAGSSYSWLPYTTSGYVGLSLGNAKLDTDCVPGQSCDDAKGAFHIYTGGMFTPYIGMQLGYFRFGDADRNGGTTKVSGVNLVLTGVAPLSQTFSLVGRVGGTYGWTDTSVGTGVPAPAGERNGFGASYGAGLSWDFNRNWSATLDWDRHHLKFAGDERKNTDVATIGFKYRF